MTSDCIYRDALLKDIEENVVFSGQTPNAEIVGANKVISRIKAAPVADTDLEWISVYERLPVVRCEECNFFSMYALTGNGFCVHEDGLQNPHQKDFCSHAERRVTNGLK